MTPTRRDDTDSLQSGQAPYDTILRESLRSELRLVNTGLPRSQKRLSHLLKERHPHVSCNDGSLHSFKRKELEYLATCTDSTEQEALLLPIVIEVGAEEAGTSVVCEGKVVEKIISKVLDMPLTCEHGRIRIYKPQLALLRGKLKTTTVYVFTAGGTA